MSDHQAIHLGVNVDHIATLRQVRGTAYPDPQQAAEIAKNDRCEIVTDTR